MIQVKLSIIILNYNSDNNTICCIESIKRSRFDTRYEIIVVDNSDKKSLDRKLRTSHKGVVYIKSKNRGYGAGNNLGIKYAKGEYIFIINPDSIVFPKTLQTLSGYLDKNPDTAIVAPNLYDKNEKLFIQMGSRELTPIRAIFSLSLLNKVFPKNPVSKRYYLFDKPLDYLREADAVPGSAFMMRKAIFVKAGKFDENMFLYFEESDLGKRIRKMEYKIVINPKAKVIHKWEAVKENENLGKHFQDSRLYYLRKHFGIVPALISEAVCRLSFYDIAFIIIFIIGAFFRFYKIESQFYFDSETADNLLVMKNQIENRTIPLVGPPTSHPWLYFAPLFYWLYIPIMIITKYEPLYHFIFGNIINLLSVILYYIVVKIYWGKKTAILTSIFMSFSPYLITFSWSARFYTYVLPLSAVYLHFLFKSFLDSKYIFWLFLILGVFCSFHYTPIILLPITMLIFLLKRMKIDRYVLLSGIAGFVIPVIPLIIDGIKNNFSMLVKFLIWIPYRLFGFTGVTSEKEIFSTKTSVLSIMTYFNCLFGISSNYIFISFVIASIFIIVIARSFAASHMRNIFISPHNQNTVVTLYIVLLSLIFLFLHGEAPMHYYLFITPMLFILIAKALLLMVGHYKHIVLVTFFAIIIIMIFSDLSLINCRDKSDSYNILEKATEIIAEDCNGCHYKLKRIGENDDFTRDFAQNYQYLLEMKGINPTAVGDIIISSEIPEIEYTIVENIKMKEYLEEEEILFDENGIVILKRLI